LGSLLQQGGAMIDGKGSRSKGNEDKTRLLGNYLFATYQC
jgi:hypothetical protein